MRTLSVLNKDKKAVSIIVSYVLLITITLSLSVLVYNWLKFYVQPNEIPECSDNVNIIIQDYFCVPSSQDPYTGVWTHGNLQITLKNKGLFNVSGFNLRVHDREDAEFGFYTLEEGGVMMVPGGDFFQQYNFSDLVVEPLHDLRTITIIEVQPFIEEEGKVICKSYAIQKVDC
ncbi:MAG: hypothetical protein KKF50_03020 [Nanoarchaeota archaeon]|nr:hypothetical protein [Nanoarchaeota archaeon]